MTGRPSRVALWVTTLSGVIGIPARGDDDMCSLFGGEGAVACGFGFVTGPRRFARAVTWIEGSAFGLVAIRSCAGSVCAEADCAPASANTSVRIMKTQRAGKPPALRP